MSENTGTLSVVATPIGNLEDMTLRALRVLGKSDIILCEDTRVSGKLLKAHDIKAVLKRCDAHAEALCAEQTIEWLSEGKHISYITDAGTPGISDPGARLVRAVRTALPDVRIESIPGASSLTAALSIAGVEGTAFTFFGFVPHKKGRETFFKEIARTEIIAVFFESTHRIIKTLEALAVHIPVERRVVLARELTKMHEEVLEGSAADILATLEADPQKQRGEFVVIVDVL